jgi:hypothetical protein
LGNLEGGSYTGDFEKLMKGGLETERLTLRESCEGNLEGVSFNGEPGGYVEKTLETGISFHRGHAGEHGRGLIYQGL